MEYKNLTDDDLVQDLNYKFSIRSLQSSIITMVVAAIGFIGNLFVLAAYWKLYKRSKHKHMKGRYFMPYLAVADLVACEVGCFVFLYFDFHRLVFISDIGCRLSTFSSWSTNAISVFMLLIISVSRYIKICRPHGKEMTLFWKRISLLIITVGSVMCCSPFLHFTGVRHVHLKVRNFINVLDLPVTLQNRTIPIHQCATAKEYKKVEWKIFYNILFFAQLGNIIAMICLYIPMGRIIYEKYKLTRSVRALSFKKKNDETERRSLEIVENVGSADLEPHSIAASTEMAESSDVTSGNMSTQVNIRSNSRRGRKRKAWSNAKNRFTLMFLVVVIVYAITNLPTFIFLYMYMENDQIRKYIVQESDFETYNLFLFLPRIHLINNIVNPFIYGYFDMNFRREVKAICNSIIATPKKCCGQ